MLLERFHMQQWSMYTGITIDFQSNHITKNHYFHCFNRSHLGAVTETEVRMNINIHT